MQTNPEKKLRILNSNLRQIYFLKIIMPQKPPKKQSSAQFIHSSTAQYLTFVSASGDDPDSIEMRYEDENIWMTQKMMAELYGVSVPAINQHISTLISTSEIDSATIKQYLIVQKEGSREVKRNKDHYNLQSITSVGFGRSTRYEPIVSWIWAREKK